SLATAVFFGVLSVGAQGLEGDPNAPAPGSSFDFRIAELLGDADRLGVDWQGMSVANVRRGRPDFVDLHGGIEAVVLEDVISAGRGLDMSALQGAETLAASVIYNGVVAPAHEIGNAYVYTTFDSVGQLVVYVGIERLEVAADSYVELELNQDRVRVTSGAPWPIRGQRTADDLLVRLDIVQGVVNSVAVKRWVAAAGAFETIVESGGLATSACNGEPTRFLFCSGSPPIAPPQEVWDAAGRPLETTVPDSFVEVGVHVGNLLGGYVDFTSIQVRSPEDVVLGSFREIGYWGRFLGEPDRSVSTSKGRIGS
ncbi:MAG: hypothetical protein V3T72_06085, partial [Thermoanaerobaculia bacterium]